MLEIRELIVAGIGWAVACGSGLPHERTLPSLRARASFSAAGSICGPMFATQSLRLRGACRMIHASACAADHLLSPVLPVIPASTLTRLNATTLPALGVVQYAAHASISFGACRTGRHAGRPLPPCSRSRVPALQANPFGKLGAFGGPVAEVERKPCTVAFFDLHPPQDHFHRHAG